MFLVCCVIAWYNSKAMPMWNVMNNCLIMNLTWFFSLVNLFGNEQLLCPYTNGLSGLLQFAQKVFQQLHC